MTTKTSQTITLLVLNIYNQYAYRPRLVRQLLTHRKLELAV